MYKRDQIRFISALFYCLSAVTIITSLSYAAPTVGSRTKFTPVPLRSAQRFPETAGTLQFSDLSENAFAAGAKNFFSPTDGSDYSNVSANSRIKVLPPVPGALLMAFMGFICITFVKDRNFWIATSVELLWAGQFGMLVLPRLVLWKTRAGRNKCQYQNVLDYHYHLENYSRLRSDIDGNRFIGLLHHLEGIPRLQKTFPTNFGSQKIYYKYRLVLDIIVSRLSLISPSNCRVYKAGQVLCFSPASIFDLIPRGPPIIA